MALKDVWQPYNVGHSLDNDLRMLDICLPRREVVDISRICAVHDRMLKETGKEKSVYSLKLMSEILLNRSIQVMQMIFLIEAQYSGCLIMQSWTVFWNTFFGSFLFNNSNDVFTKIFTTKLKGARCISPRVCVVSRSPVLVVLLRCFVMKLCE